MRTLAQSVFGPPSIDERRTRPIRAYAIRERRPSARTIFERPPRAELVDATPRELDWSAADRAQERTLIDRDGGDRPCEHQREDRRDRRRIHPRGRQRRMREKRVEERGLKVEMRSFVRGDARASAECAIRSRTSP